MFEARYFQTIRSHDGTIIEVSIGERDLESFISASPVIDRVLVRRGSEERLDTVYREPLDTCLRQSDTRTPVRLLLENLAEEISGGLPIQRSLDRVFPPLEDLHG